MEVNQNYKDLLRGFDRHQVRFLVVGGFAVMLYTEPYTTKDLDVWVEPGLQFAETWRRRNIADFEGHPTPFLSREDLVTSKRSSGRHRDLLQLKRLLRSASKDSRTT